MMGNCHPMKCAKSVVEEEEEVDRLSQLPSGVLSHILSLAFPTMKDAARTSVLSQFWRHRWLFDVDEFDFDIHRWFGEETAYKNCPLIEEMVKYVERVTNVLSSHREATLDINDDDKILLIKKLRINMPLTKAFQENIDSWISYAFARRVESLEIKLLLTNHHMFYSLIPNQSYGRCCFPDKLERNLDCLRSLSLTGVNVTGDDITSFLGKFRFLECLKVSRSPALESVEVCGSSLALKHLEILDCQVECAVVRDTCLVSLTVSWMKKLVLVNNPKLIVVCGTRWNFFFRDERRLQQFSGCFSTVEVFMFGTAYVDDVEVIDEVPLLSHLKQLTLIGDPSFNVTLTTLTALLGLSPKLEKLTLEFEMVTLWDGKKANYEIEGPRFPLQHLKTVEVCEYCGVEDGILMFFFKHTLAPIKRVIFDAVTEISEGNLADELRRSIPSSAELIFI